MFAYHSSIASVESRTYNHHRMIEIGLENPET